LKKLGFKSGSVADDTLLKNMLYVDMSRALGVTMQRASYTLFYINDVYAEKYSMHELIDPIFMAPRILSDDDSGDTMKFFWDMSYYGASPSYYQTAATTNRLGVVMNWFEQSSGNGDWTDFIDWLYFINSSSHAQFAQVIESQAETTNLLREMMVEAFLLSSDSLEGGWNNYAHHLNYKWWQIIDFDFDEIFAADGDMNPNVFDFHTRNGIALAEHTAV